MDISSLTIFVDVIRRGSFAAVARSRGVDPSSVSRAIGVLEDGLGLRLLQRSTRRLALTEAGRVYFERVEPLVEELERARLAARDVSAGPSGTLRVTTTVSFGQLCVLPLLPEFRRAFPALALELLFTDANLDLIGEGVDVAIRLGPRLDVGYVGTKLFATRYRVCASPAYVATGGKPAMPAEVARHSCITFDLAGFRDRWLFRAGDGDVTEVPIASTLRLSSALAIRQCALDGMGPALLGHWMVDGDIAAGTLIDLFPDHGVTASDFETAAWILYPSRSYLPAKVRAFVDFMRVAMSRHLLPA